MIHGLDTEFLVAAEVAERPAHATSRMKLNELIAGGDSFQRIGRTSLMLGESPR